MATLAPQKLKRIHLFEFEDFAWFPGWIRVCMTRYLAAFHKLLGTHDVLAKLLARALKHSQKAHILDLCSGSGGPMPEVVQLLRQEYGCTDVQLSLSDLYPDLAAAHKINADTDPATAYITTPVNAAKIGPEFAGVRTMVCSLHHMKPAVAHQILKDARSARQPICIYEISDNSAPIALWWIALPVAFLMTFFITPFVRPLSWQQLVFTYLIPIIPLFIAWDGAVSNARTYSLKDLEVLTQDLQAETYTWEKGTIKGRGGNKLYLLGLPVG